MRCLKCGSVEDKVIDSRMTKDGASIRRRRECLECKSRFTTYEVLETKELYVVKKDKRREPFDREKLLHSLSRASEKRPVSRDMLEEAAESITAELASGRDQEVSAKQIGLLVMRNLKTMDPVAYVRYASVYRSFEDVGEFIDEIKTLRSHPAVDANHPELFASETTPSS